MKTKIPSSTTFLERVILIKILLICGILSTVLYIGADIIAAISYEGYSYTSQAISELSAIGAPSRSFLGLTGVVYLFLVTAFGTGVWLIAGQRRILRIVAILLIVYGLVGLLWPFAPMQQREALETEGGTIKDTMHLILGAVDMLLFLFMIGFGAALFGWRFRIYSIATIIIFLVFGTIMSFDVPRVAENDPTPWLGVTERITVFSPMIWIIVLTILLLRSEKGQDSINVTIPDQRQSQINPRNMFRQPAWQRIILLIVLGYEGLGALTGGSLLVAEPSGRLMDMPIEIMHGVFSDFLVPGLILVGLGILNTTAFVAVLHRSRIDWLLAGLGLGGLTVWFIVEIVILKEFHWLHAMWGMPVLVGDLVTLPLVLSRRLELRLFRVR